MTAQLFQFPDSSQLSWAHMMSAVRVVAYERSGSNAIADRVLEKVEPAYKRCIPISVELRSDSVESMREDVTAMLNTVVAAILKEITTLATDAEMLLATAPSGRSHD